MEDEKDDPAGEVVINPEEAESNQTAVEAPELDPAYLGGGAVRSMMDHLRNLRNEKTQPNLLDNLKEERQRIAQRLMNVDKAIELVEANPVVLEVQQLLIISEQ